MTYRAAVMMMEGFEESETVQIIDLLRRAGMEVTSYRFQEDPYVHSMQDMYIKSDAVFCEDVKDCDILIIPGGRTSWPRLIDCKEFMHTLKWFDENGKKIAAMCSGTRVIQAAGVIRRRNVTGYTGYEDILIDGNFVNDVVVSDRNLITSQGPATPYPFAFAIMEDFGIDSTELKERLKYAMAHGR